MKTEVPWSARFRRPAARTAHAWLPAVVLALTIAIMGLFSLPFNLQYLLTLSMAWAIAAIGLDLSTGLAGQPLFGQTAFIAIGAYTFSICNSRWTLSIPLCILISLALTALISLVVGAAMVRLKNLGAVLTTFFFAFLVTALITSDWLTSLTEGANGIPAPVLGISSQAFYYVSLLVLAVIFIISNNFAGSRSGRALRLIRRNATIADTVGVNPPARRLGVFVYAALLACIAGVLLALSLGFISPDAFPANQSIVMFAMIAVGGIGTVWGAVLGAILLTLLPSLLQNTGGNSDIVFALILLVFLVVLPAGLAGGLRSLIELARRRAGSTRGRTDDMAAEEATLRSGESVEQLDLSTVGAIDRSGLLRSRAKEGGTTVGLDLENVSINFGGVQALDDVSLRVHGGSVHALIGPNGAGKTTLLNCITGVQNRWSGAIRVGDLELAARTPARAIARAGASRTFQNASLVLDMDAVENVGLGLYGHKPWSALRDYVGPLANRRLEAHVREQAHAALDLVGLRPSRRHIVTSNLSLAEWKMIDIARALAAEPRLLILDEPTAGLSGEEIDACAQLITALNVDLGVTVLVVSHHVGFIRNVAHRATVLDFGCVLADGTPADLLSDPAVVDAFLGSEASNA